MEDVIEKSYSYRQWGVTAHTKGYGVSYDIEPPEEYEEVYQEENERENEGSSYVIDRYARGVLPSTLPDWIKGIIDSVIAKGTATTNN